MRAVTLLAVCLSALLSCGSGDDKRSFISLVELVELDYEDHCDRRATASWDELAGKGISAKLETDKAFGFFAKQQTTDVKSAFKSNSLADDDDVFRRKIKLLLQPGDTMLETEQWIRLVTFGDTALHNIRFANDYECDNNATCNFRELQNSIARQPDEEKLIRMKQSWEKKLPNMSVYLEQILPLLKNASKENGHNTVEEYWDALAEYEGAILKARELWDHIKPLYVKLHKYVAMKLKGPEAVGKPLPVYLFKSLTGDNWSNLIESLLPIHPDVYKKLQVNLYLKGLGGLKAFDQASKLIQELNMGEFDTQVWAESIFNGTCPTTIVDWCKPNRVRVASCKDVSISNYLDAHESAMKVKYKQITAVHSNITYVLREAPRYSAVYEAIPGFASLLALNPHALDRAGLYPLERFNYNPNHNRLVLQLILALRDLPKLNYYLAADEWRLKVLMGEIKASKAASSWNEFRQNFSLVNVSDVDILGDSYVLFNKPYIGKFMGLVLKYQIYHSFAEELISDDSDLVEHISANNGRLTEAMMQGFGVVWPEMIRDLLASRENGLEYTGVTDYYRLLDEYLDNQLDPSTDTNEIDDYVEPVTSEPEILDNEISNNQEHVEEIQREPETHESIVNNNIDSGDEHHSKFGTETSTSVAVMEIKNAPKEEIDNGMNTKAASYNTYWWIGIVIALAVVVVIIAIVARKRHNHRKELERQRRDTSHA